MNAEQVKAAFGFEVPDLPLDASRNDTSMNQLQFDSNEYTALEDFAFNIIDLPAKPATKRPSCKSLSVNGKVIQDKMEKYLAASGESSSALKEVLKTPIHYLIYKNEKLEPKDVSHFNLGTFIHSAFLEPTKFDRVKVLPEGGVKNTINGLIKLINYYRELLCVKSNEVLEERKLTELKEILFDLEQAAEAQGYSFISAQDQQIVNIIRRSYKSYGGGIIPKLIANGRTEVSMYGKDESTGLKVKIRPDCILLEEQVGANIILSVKTTSATSIEGFMRDAAKYRYELAEGMYLKVASEITGRPFTGTLMLIAQTCIPFQCALLWLDAEDLACGKYKYQQAMDIVKQCRESNSWPGFEAFAEDPELGIIKVNFPQYIKAELKPQYIPTRWL